MSDKFIIYPNAETGGVFLMIPTGELSVEETAKKDVPTGLPYKIINREDFIPDADFAFFEAVEADFSSPDGHGADYGRGSHNAVSGWDDSGAPIIEVMDHIQ